MAVLRQLPALVALDSIPVPVLATEHDGSILFTNSAFGEMLGRRPDDLLSLRFDQIFHHTAGPQALVSATHAVTNMVVELIHRDGSIVRALMSRSILRRADDRFILSAFRDLTTHLWENER
ncbi:PAS domain-containing protein [Mycobacterium parmense]|uniref:PAS domain-containing protein n=1 Tax=Mycobacterium parmense TaxID=185642 RepID=UPI000A24676C|nr:PAS domain-containing protein [Mycobacterium parmense]MCV7352696.1 PAS domain-containing protein [Mycobacterium parmense]ORW54680.1 histidine kinase [Mycobacterium parmense]